MRKSYPVVAASIVAALLIGLFAGAALAQSESPGKGGSMDAKATATPTPRPDPVLTGQRKHDKATMREGFALMAAASSSHFDEHGANMSADEEAEEVVRIAMFLLNEIEAQYPRTAPSCDEDE